MTKTVPKRTNSTTTSPIRLVQDKSPRKQSVFGTQIQQYQSMTSLKTQQSQMSEDSTKKSFSSNVLLSKKKDQPQVYETHQSLAYKWIQGYINDKQLLQQAQGILSEYVQDQGQRLTFDQAELQSLGDAIFVCTDRADQFSQDFVLPALKSLSQASLQQGWDQRQYINKLKDRISVRDQQLKIAEEKQVN